MKITKEQFNKLNQLDRIEYRQKYNQIMYYPLIYLILFMGSMVISCLSQYFIDSIIFFGIEIWMLIKIYKTRKFMNQLEEEYFNIQKVKRNERGKS